MNSSTPDTDSDPIEDLLTRLEDAESRLEELAREAEHLQRLATIGTVAAGIVHEINNQLTPALAQAQIARLNANEPARLLNAVDQCIHGITRAGRIAETLVGFASPTVTEQGGRRAGANKQIANVAQAIKSALTCLGTSHERAAVRIETDVPPAAWVSIEPLALQQVLINLLLNSIKALTEARDPVIRISVKRIDGHLLDIVVEDNGPGIPKSMRQRLFAPFASAPASKRSAKGTGLGLAVSSRLVQAANGTISASESEWGGAKFTIRLNSISSASRAKSA